MVIAFDNFLKDEVESSRGFKLLTGFSRSDILL